MDEATKKEFNEEVAKRVRHEMKRVERIANVVQGVATAFVILLIIAGIIVGGFYGLPKWGVWRKTLAGRGDLLKAEQTRKILIEQAKAEQESAVLRAKAIEIMGDAAKKYPEYRMQEFIGAFGEALQNDTINTIIYVPTEANMPILEAGRMKTE